MCEIIIEFIGGYNFIIQGDLISYSWAENKRSYTWKVHFINNSEDVYIPKSSLENTDTSIIIRHAGIERKASIWAIYPINLDNNTYTIKSYSNYGDLRKEIRNIESTISYK